MSVFRQLPTRVALLCLAIGLVGLAGCGEPVEIRADGQLPDLAGMLGNKQRVAQKMLGSSEMLYEGDVAEDAPGDGGWASYRSLTLPDLFSREQVNASIGMDDSGRVVMASLSMPPDYEANWSHRANDFPENLLSEVGVRAVQNVERSQVRHEAGSLQILQTWKGIAQAREQHCSWTVYYVHSGPDMQVTSVFVELVLLSDSEVAVTGWGEEEAVGDVQVPESSPERDAPGQPDVPEGAQMEDVLTAGQLGGVPLRGETFWFVVGASQEVEGDAWWLLSDAYALFGDAQTYFFVEESSHIDGFEPGYWVVIEAYRDRENAQSGLEWATRAFSDAYLKQGTLTCDDPIPVVEDLVPGF